MSMIAVSSHTQCSSALLTDVPQLCKNKLHTYAAAIAPYEEHFAPDSLVHHAHEICTMWQSHCDLNVLHSRT